MKSEFRTKIEKIIEGYKGNMEVMQNEIRKVAETFQGVEFKKYKPEYIIETMDSTVDEAKESAAKINKVLNQKLMLTINEARKSIYNGIYPAWDKPSDYAMKINNALQFINLERDEITDQSAHMILKDIIGDYDQMKLFKKIVGNRVDLENAEGGTMFPITFGRLNKMDSIFNAFNEIDEMAASLFLHGKITNESVIIGSLAYPIPDDGYDEIGDEDAILGYTDIIDNITRNIEEIYTSNIIDDVTKRTENVYISNIIDNVTRKIEAI